MSTCQVTIMPRVTTSATCQFVVVLFLFVQFSSDIRYFFCNSVSIFVIFV